MNKPEFYEDYQSPCVDPLALPSSATFDWEGLYEQLGEGEPQSDTDKIILAIRRIFEWVVKRHKNSPKRISIQTVGLRFTAFLWAMDPRYFNGISLKQLSKQYRFSEKCLSTYSAEARREFDLCNRYSANHWRFKGALRRSATVVRPLEAKAETPPAPRKSQGIFFPQCRAGRSGQALRPHDCNAKGMSHERKRTKIKRKAKKGAKWKH
jgi:hypothetical protein